MKLNPEGVEKATDALFNFRAERPLWGREATEARARAALTAYFDHLKSKGKMQDAMGILAAPYGIHWVAATQPTTGDFKAIIIKAEEQTNGEA